jgi:hypothetical protein
MKIKEPEVTREIRVVRDRMARRVEQEGIFAFYAGLHGRAAKLMALHRSPQRAALPRSIEGRSLKRRALVNALPESSAIREVRGIRQELIADKDRAGTDQYWSEVNRHGKELARRHGLKYAASPPGDYILHDKPAKKVKVN